MANWAYGWLEVSGPKENVLEFLNRHLVTQRRNEDSTQVHFYINEDDKLEAYADDDYFHMWIRGSNRQFVEFEMDRFEYDNGVLSGSMSLEAAWSLDHNAIAAISRLGVHADAYISEWGMFFAQHIIYNNGKLLKDSYRKLNGEDYEEEFEGEKYDWEDE